MSAPGLAANFAKAIKSGKPFQAVIATANDLSSGVVVFRTADAQWSRLVSQAEVADTAEQAEQLRLAAEQDQNDNKVIDLALIPVVHKSGAIQPVALREKIRADGPTVPIPGSRHDMSAHDMSASTPCLTSDEG